MCYPLLQLLLIYAIYRAQPRSLQTETCRWPHPCKDPIMPLGIHSPTLIQLGDTVGTYPSTTDIQKVVHPSSHDAFTYILEKHPQRLNLNIRNRGWIPSSRKCLLLNVWLFFFFSLVSSIYEHCFEANILCSIKEVKIITTERQFGLKRSLNHKVSRSQTSVIFAFKISILKSI